MQLSVAQRNDGLDVIKVDSGHLIHFDFDDIRALPGIAPHDVIQGPENIKPADRTTFAAAAWQRAVDFGTAHHLI